MTLVGSVRSFVMFYPFLFLQVIGACAPAKSFGRSGLSRPIEPFGPQNPSLSIPCAFFSKRKTNPHRPVMDVRHAPPSKQRSRHLPPSPALSTVFLAGSLMKWRALPWLQLRGRWLQLRADGRSSGGDGPMVATTVAACGLPALVLVPAKSLTGCSIFFHGCSSIVQMLNGGSFFCHWM